MVTRDNRLFANLNILLDIILIIAAYYLAIYVRFFVMDGVVSLELWDYPLEELEHHDLDRKRLRKERKSGSHKK